MTRIVNLTSNPYFMTQNCFFVPFFMLLRPRIKNRPIQKARIKHRYIQKTCTVNKTWIQTTESCDNIVVAAKMQGECDRIRMIALAGGPQSGVLVSFS